MITLGKGDTMARTPLAGAVQDAVAAVAAGERRTTRTRFVKDAGAAALGLTALGRFAAPARGATAPKIVVVGAGLAGLNAAYTLRQAGYTAEIHEASDRIGGRCWTHRGAFADGQIAEHGGELIDQGHTHIRQLAQGFRAQAQQQQPGAGGANDAELLGWFDGAPLSPKTRGCQTTSRRRGRRSMPMCAQRAIRQPVRDLDRARAASSTTCRSSTDGGDLRGRDQLPDRAVPRTLPTTSSTAPSHRAELTREFSLLAYRGPGNLRLFGASNEKYHIAGGNDQITDRLARGAAGADHDRVGLVALRGTPRARSRSPSQADGDEDDYADKVVLALPFWILRSSVDISKASSEPLKLVAINEQGMGTNSKLHVQFSSRFWRAQGVNGDTFSDTGYQNTWEVTRAQGGTSGILVDYTGGTIGASFGSGTPESRAKQFLAQIEPVLPGATKAWNGKASIDFWPGYRWTKGSYSYWKVGQYQRFAGMEARRQGNCLFAGEHTSIDFQGYLNGAVETGQRAAAEILADLK